jgi:murein DD-endopeptidase MepM/ murein hydrolase activator NlpD
MSRIKFKYNPATLRFERVKISVFNVIAVLIGYLSVGALFFVGLLLLQEYLMESPAEKKLRAENKALQQHKVIMAGQVWANNLQLDELKKQDEALYKKLFESDDTDRASDLSSHRIEILSSDATQFYTTLHRLMKETSWLKETGRQNNQYFFQTASIRKEDLPSLQSIPSIAPVSQFDVSKLVSGFGTRIHPFHKGHYHHDGVDIAAARGTPVLAAGSGRVMVVKRSDLVAGYGNYIEVEHGGGLVTRYSHLEDILVRAGQKIKKGEAIGTVGTSGGSIAPHLHYEVVKDGNNIDPIRFFIENLSADQFKELYTRSKKKNQSLD